MPGLEEFFKTSHYHMADVSRKPATFRRAVATGRFMAGEVGFTHIKNGTLPKGDVLKLSEIAGVQGAKSAATLMPMCHPLPLDHVAVYLELEPASLSVAVYAMVSTTAKTGVEMEAIAAVSAALLTLYDLTKPVEPALAITDIRLLLKEGGKKGLWLHPDGIPESLSALLPASGASLPLAGRKAAVITMSDRAHAGVYADKSGAALKDGLAALGCDIVEYSVLPDEPVRLEEKIRELEGRVALIVTTGGTGIAPRDRTPDTIRALADREIPGIGEWLRASAAPHIPAAWLSRSLAVVLGKTLIISLPGSTGGVKDGLAALGGILPHALALVGGEAETHT